MKKLISILTVAALLVSCSNSSSVTNVNTQDFLTKTQEANVVVIDVRTADEFAQGHLLNAININVEGGMFEESIATLDKSATYAVYCRSGRRSAIATEKMAKAGFTSLFNLQGAGFLELAQAGAVTA